LNNACGGSKQQLGPHQWPGRCLALPAQAQWLSSPSPYYLLPPHACSRHKLLAPARAAVVLTVSLPTPPAKKRGKSVHYSPHAIWFPVGFAQKQTGLLEKCDKWALNNYEHTPN
jgi:hypothetical protein